MLDLLATPSVRGHSADELAVAAAGLLDVCGLPHCGPALLHVAGLLADLGASDDLVADVLKRVALGEHRGVAAPMDLAA